MNAGVALAMVLVTGSACKDSPLDPPIVTAPEPAAPPPSQPPASAPPIFPQPSSAAGVYDRVTSSFIVGSSSRYVLNADGTMKLQYITPQFGFFEYLGSYSRAGSVLSFDFDGWGGLGPWEAVGTLSGDSLTVKYNESMIWTDFEDGVYVRSQGTSP